MLKIFFLFAISILPVTACSDTTSPKKITTASQSQSKEKKITPESKHQVLINDALDLLIIGDPEKTIATMFASHPSSPAELSNKILWILKNTGTSNEFQALLAARLPKNRLLTKNAFVLPLFDSSGKKYTFEYISDVENHIYTLNYKEEK